MRGFAPERQRLFPAQRRFDVDVFERLEEQIGREHLSRRLRLQVDHSAKFFGAGLGTFHWENSHILPSVLSALFKTLGVFDQGRRSTMAYEVKEIAVTIPHLPSAFDGFRILQLSDIHIDGIPDRGEKLSRLIAALDFDLCLITGDYRFDTFGDYSDAVTGMDRLMGSIKCPHGTYGILGNHDFIEMIPGLEASGIRMLLNDAAPIERGNEVIWVVGLDDVHFYGAHDLYKPLGAIPDHHVKILMVHSPEIIPDAANAGVDYYLCGHTHGGQVCLPGNLPVWFNASCTKEFAVGPWRYRNMQGYTSRGTGSSGLAVRYYCPPEITLHKLVLRR
jgi:uncharacterized protein